MSLRLTSVYLFLSASHLVWQTDFLAFLCNSIYFSLFVFLCFQSYSSVLFSKKPQKKTKQKTVINIIISPMFL